MCVDKITDVKQTVMSSVVVTATTTGTVVLSKNNRRRAVVLNSNTINDLLYSFAASIPSSNNGIWIKANNPPMILRFSDIGSAIFDQLVVFSGASTPSAIVCEFTEA